jgi:hypothetical protein
MDASDERWRPLRGLVPSRSIITTDLGDAASTLPRMVGRPGQVATAASPSTKPLLVSKMIRTLRLIFSENWVLRMLMGAASLLQGGRQETAVRGQEV